MELTDGDREQLYERLAAHAARDHIDLGELQRRVAALAAATTREQAAAILADLPALGTEPPPRPAAWGRGHAEADAPEAGWRATAERFRDPNSGAVMRVWEDADGGRRYVRDDG